MHLHVKDLSASPRLPSLSLRRCLRCGAHDLRVHLEHGADASLGPLGDRPRGLERHLVGRYLDAAAASAGALRRAERPRRPAGHRGHGLGAPGERPGVDDRERHLHGDERADHRGLLPRAPAPLIIDLEGERC